MTAPVLQRRDDTDGTPATVETVARETSPGRYVVSFVMPQGSTRESLPDPGDARVAIRAVPEDLAAVARYSGRWTSTSYEQQTGRLLRAVRDAGLKTTGPPRFARFDPPWTPWFRRRNEVVVPVRRTLTSRAGSPHAGGLPRTALLPECSGPSSNGCSEMSAPE